MRLWRTCAALAAVLVVGAIGSSSASAKEFHVTAVGTSLSSVNSEALKITMQSTSFTCGQDILTGTALASSSPTQALHPSYSNCTLFAPIAANTAECDYIFGASTGLVDLSGCKNGGIVFNWESIFGKCAFRIPNQTGVSSASYLNDSNNETYTITMQLQFKAEVTTDTGACPYTLGTHTLSLVDGQQILPASGSTWVA
jgi:hypothetical protein